MILSDCGIRSACEAGTIRIDPFEEQIVARGHSGGDGA